MKWFDIGAKKRKTYKPSWLANSSILSVSTNIKLIKLGIVIRYSKIKREHGARALFTGMKLGFKTIVCKRSLSMKQSFMLYVNSKRHFCSLSHFDIWHQLKLFRFQILIEKYSTFRAFFEPAAWKQNFFKLRNVIHLKI